MPLLDPRRFREIISGERNTVGASVFRQLTGCVEPVMAMATAFRGFCYDRGWAKSTAVPAPVISIGNITLGGTGKTPIVAWVARQLLDAGHPVTLISRGYGSQAGQANDEARELAIRLPAVPHLQNPRRVVAARQALAGGRDMVLLLDDAFQHRRIARNLDIVLLDALEPFGFERLFPRGTLREYPAALKRAQAVILTRADLVDSRARSQLQARVAQLAPHTLWAEVAFVPTCLRSVSGRVQALPDHKDQVIAFCGIGNPAGFRQTLLSSDWPVLDLLVFPDHQRYTSREFQYLERWAEKFPEASAILCTLKDLVKFEAESIARRPLFALETDVKFLRGETQIGQLLRETVRRRFDAVRSAT